MAIQFFTEQQQQAIIQAIKEAEKNTSGEVQVHIERKCKDDVLDRAANVFALLNMHKTKERNGVLFYLAVEDRKFAILGDAGINAKVQADFWDTIKNDMQQSFKKGDYTEGLCNGIKEAGRQMKKYFPYQMDDTNELPDEISFGKE